MRREHIRWLGFKRPPSWPRMVGIAFGAAVLLQLFTAGVIMPVMKRLTGASIDTSGFAGLRSVVMNLV